MYDYANTLGKAARCQPLGDPIGSFIISLKYNFIERNSTGTHTPLHAPSCNRRSTGKKGNGGPTRLLFFDTVVVNIDFGPILLLVWIFITHPDPMNANKTYKIECKAITGLHLYYRKINKKLVLIRVNNMYIKTATKYLRLYNDQLFKKIKLNACGFWFRRIHITIHDPDYKWSYNRMVVSHRTRSTAKYI